MKKTRCIQALIFQGMEMHTSPGRGTPPRNTATDKYGDETAFKVATIPVGYKTEDYLYAYADSHLHRNSYESKRRTPHLYQYLCVCTVMATTMAPSSQRTR